MKNFSRSVLAAAVTVLICGPGLSAEPTREDLSFTLQQGHLVVVRGSLAGQELRVVIDTGATHSLVKKGTVKRLRLNTLPEAYALNAFGKKTKVKRVVLRGLRVGTVMTSLPCFVGDIPWPKIDAIAGMDFLEGRNFTIDYEAKTILFGSGNHFASSTPFALESGHLVVAATVWGKKVRLVVDSGAPTLNLYRKRVKSWIGKLPSDGVRQIHHVAGKSRHEEVWLPGIELGQVDCGGVRGLVLDSSKERKDGIDGVLGLRGLGIDQIYFDFSSNTLSWER